MLEISGQVHCRKRSNLHIKHFAHFIRSTTEAKPSFINISPGIFHSTANVSNFLISHIDFKLRTVDSVYLWPPFIIEMERKKK